MSTTTTSEAGTTPATPTTSTTTTPSREPLTITFLGAKGGVGTTTVAALTALQLARWGSRVRLTATKAANLGDLASMFDLDRAPLRGEIVQVAPGLTLAHAPAPDGDNIIDGGTAGRVRPQGRVILVTTNESLSVRRAERSAGSGDGLVLLVNSTQGFDSDLVEEIVLLPVFAEIPITRIAARLVHEGGTRPHALGEAARSDRRLAPPHGVSGVQHAHRPVPSFKAVRASGARRT